MAKKGKQNKVSEEVANPTVSRDESREIERDSVQTAKQARKNK